MRILVYGAGDAGDQGPRVGFRGREAAPGLLEHGRDLESRRHDCSALRESGRPLEHAEPVVRPEGPRKPARPRVRRRQRWWPRMRRHGRSIGGNDAASSPSSPRSARRAGARRRARDDDAVLLYTLERVCDAIAEGELRDLGLAVAPTLDVLRALVERSIG